MSAGFDAVAADYDAQLGKGLDLTGDSAEHYARGRLALLRQRLDQLAFRADSVIDFGCGTGRSIPLFREYLSATRILGVDTSAESVALAAGAFGGNGVEFGVLGGDPSPVAQPYDLVFTNGVFHHIPLAERPGALAWIRERLRPGGIFAFWENNPWNPGTRLVMSRIPFDRDAITLSPPTARRLLRQNGFDVLRTDYAFFFPAQLKGLRGLEPALRWVPVGGQYMVVGRAERAR